MKWTFILLVLLCCGCATGRTTIVVSGEIDGVDVAAYYEVGPAKAGKP